MYTYIDSEFGPHIQDEHGDLFLSCEFVDPEASAKIVKALNGSQNLQGRIRILKSDLAEAWKLSRNPDAKVMWRMAEKLAKLEGVTPQVIIQRTTKELIKCTT